MRRHLVLRPDRQIEREVPVCVGCHRELQSGQPLNALIARHRKPVPQVVADATAKPPAIAPLTFKTQQPQG